MEQKINQELYIVKKYKNNINQGNIIQISMQILSEIEQINKLKYWAESQKKKTVVFNKNGSIAINGYKEFESTISVGDSYQADRIVKDINMYYQNHIIPNEMLFLEDKKVELFKDYKICCQLMSEEN